MNKIWVVRYNDGTADVVDDDPSVDFVAPSWPYIDAFHAEARIVELEKEVAALSNVSLLDADSKAIERLYVRGYMSDSAYATAKKRLAKQAIRAV